MKTVVLGAAIAVGCGLGVGAQSTTVKSETEVEVKNGKKVEVTGCLERSAGGGFVLTRVEATDADVSHAYFLVGEENELENHLGHLVRIEGKATDKSDEAELEVRTKTEVERDSGDDRETESKTEIQGHLTGVPYLGVQDVEMVRETC